MRTVVHHRVETSWGPCLLAWSEVGLARVRLPGSAVDEAAEPAGDGPGPAEAMARWSRAIRDYFDGRPVDFDALPLDTRSLTATEAAIYAALRAVPYGRTTTYGELAEKAGLPVGAARAVGVAMGRNPWPLVVPCHRVLARHAVGGFSAPGGVATKRRMLALEGVDLDGGQATLPGLFAD